MSNGQTIQQAVVLELKNVPTELILYACTQWNYCGKYVTKGTGKNTNPFLQNIAVWLVLKNETPTGKIKNYRKQMKYLAEKCKLSTGAMEKRLRWLRCEGLLQVEDRKHLVMSGYKVLRKYGIDIGKREEEAISYDYTKKAELASILVAITIGKMKTDWMDTYWKKMTKNPDALAVVSSVLVQNGADERRLADPGYFRQRHLDLLMKTYQDESSGQSSFNLLHRLIDANPDLNAKAATYGRRMGYSVKEKVRVFRKRDGTEVEKDESESMGFTHLRRRLAKKGLIAAKMEHIESNYRARKSEETFHHRYVEEKKKTIWYRPIQIWINYAAFYTA